MVYCDWPEESSSDREPDEDGKKKTLWIFLMALQPHDAVGFMLVLLMVSPNITQGQTAINVFVRERGNESGGAEPIKGLCTARQ